MRYPSPIIWCIIVSLGLHLMAWWVLPDMVKPRQLDMRWAGGRGDGTVVMVGFAPLANDGSRAPTPADPGLSDVTASAITAIVPTHATATDSAKPTVSRRKPGEHQKPSAKTPRKKPPQRKHKSHGFDLATESGRGNSPTPASGIGNGLDSGGIESDAPNILAKIRREIARRQHYPESARAQKLKGTVKVNFKINADGDLSYVTVTSTSGHEVLDMAAVNTVKKAAPFPYYPRPITLSLEYRLEAGR